MGHMIQSAGSSSAPGNAEWHHAPAILKGTRTNAERSRRLGYFAGLLRVTRHSPLGAASQ